MNTKSIKKVKVAKAQEQAATTVTLIFVRLRILPEFCVQLQTFQSTWAMELDSKTDPRKFAFFR